MLAEGDLGRMHKVRFDATYTWSDFSMLKLIAAGKRPAFALDSVIIKNDSSFHPTHYDCILPATMMKIVGIKPISLQCLVNLMHHLLYLHKQ
jgi:hypothetical protein